MLTLLTVYFWQVVCRYSQQLVITFKSRTIIRDPYVSGPIIFCHDETISVRNVFRINYDPVVLYINARADYVSLRTCPFKGHQ